MSARVWIRASLAFVVFAVPTFTLAAGADAPPSTEGLPAELSVGAVRDKLEETAVRVLAKLGDAFAISEDLQASMPAPDARYGRFNILSRELKIDASDNGKFGSVTARYGLQHYLVGLDTQDVPGVGPIRKSNGHMHVFTTHLGVDADRNFKNRDVLLEIGYVPVMISRHAALSGSCWKLGVNPIVGVSAQVGKRYRSTDPENLLPGGESSGSLRRLKAEGRMDFPLSCLGVKRSSPVDPNAKATSALDLILADLSTWQLQLRTAQWKDFSEERTFRKHEMVLRIPSGVKPNMYLDLRRDIGAAPTEFDTGAKFGVNLTVQF